MKKFSFRLATKIFIPLFILTLVATPVGFAYAQTSGTSVGGGLTSSGQPVNQPNQGNGSNTTYGGAGSAIASGTATCSVGQLLANLLTSTVTSGINAITGSATSQVTNQVTDTGTGLAVPTSDSKTHTNTDITNNNFARFNNARVGGGQASDVTGSFLGGITGIKDVSWDSIAFCIANEMIKYIAQSTIQWIKSGFKGQPVFVDNPQRFFQGLADQEAGAFVQQLVGNTTGINVCQPFKVQLAIDTINSYNSTLKSGLNCSLSKIANNYNQFVGGNFSAGGIPGWFELSRPQNNIYGAGIMANQESILRVYQKQNTATIELNWAHGYKSFKVCDQGYDANGNCPGGERTTTLGGYIENAVNVRGASAQHRLEIATQFDQVVSALVNELIQIAINKAFEKSNTQ